MYRPRSVVLKMLAIAEATLLVAEFVDLPLSRRSSERPDSIVFVTPARKPRMFRYFRHRIRRRPHVGCRSNHRRQGAGRQAQRTRRAGRPRCVGRARALCADGAGAAAGARPNPCSSRARKSASPDFFSKWRNAPGSRNAIDLPMSRQDIADYLGLTIETVSRTLTSLETAATIDVPTSRRIVLRNRSALSRMNG